MDNNEFNMPNVHIGDSISTWMKENGITQIQLSAMVDIPQPSISRILRNKTIDTGILYSISLSLNHNFFFEYCDNGESINVSRQMTFDVANIGYVIRHKLREKHISNKELALRLGVDSSTITKLLKRQSLDTGKLVDISKALEYNFFEEYCRPVSSKFKDYLMKLDPQLNDFFSQRNLVTVPTSIPIEILEKFHIIANQTGMSMGELLNLAISDFTSNFDENGEKK